MIPRFPVPRASRRSSPGFVSLLLSTAILLTACAPHRAQTSASPAEPIHTSIPDGDPFRITEYSRTTPAGPVRGWAATIRLDDPRLKILVSEPFGLAASDPKGTETHLRTVPEFMDATGATLAVNASFFGRVDGKRGWVPSAAVDVIGPWKANGRVYSPGRTAGQGEPVLAIRPASKGSLARIACALAPEYADAQAVLAGTSKADGGGCLILQNGEIVAEHARVEPDVRHPRTAVGVSADGLRLFVLVVDGRQPGWSVGATLPELGAWMREIGASDAINFDGGGSSSFIARRDDGTTIQNRPSDGKWRPVATAIGFRVD